MTRREKVVDALGWSLIIAVTLSLIAFAMAVIAIWELLTLPFRPWLNRLHREGRL